jgi:hypothetical protein|eukprot:COSAG01_NODE_8208_length_2874_cov_3.616577_2_plen_79_part_00
MKAIQLGMGVSTAAAKTWRRLSKTAASSGECRRNSTLLEPCGGSEAAPLRGRHDVFLSVEGGGHVAIDWLRFERSQAI